MTTEIRKWRLIPEQAQQQVRIEVAAKAAAVASRIADENARAAFGAFAGAVDASLAARLARTLVPPRATGSDYTLRAIEAAINERTSLLVPELQRIRHLETQIQERQRILDALKAQHGAIIKKKKGRGKKKTAGAVPGRIELVSRIASRYENEPTSDGIDAIGLVDDPVAGRAHEFEDEPLRAVRETFRRNLHRVRQDARPLLEVLERCEELELRMGGPSSTDLV